MEPTWDSWKLSGTLELFLALGMARGGIRAFTNRACRQTFACFSPNNNQINELKTWENWFRQAGIKTDFKVREIEYRGKMEERAELAICSTLWVKLLLIATDRRRTFPSEYLTSQQLRLVPRQFPEFPLVRHNFGSLI